MAFEDPGLSGEDGLGRWGRVVQRDGLPGWLVVAPDGSTVEPIAEFLLEFAARGNRPGSVRSYAYALLRWWRWLRRVDVAWDRATSAEVRDLVLWLSRAPKSRRFPRTVSAATAGGVNAVTGKPYLSDQYAPRTVRHSNAVIRAFYEFWLERGEGPLVNPVALARPAGDGVGRAHAHHNPLQPFGAGGRLRHNPKVARRRPRALSDEQWTALFAALRSNRDRALCALAVSSGARAGELLGMRPVDLDWGEQLIRVVRKGSWAEQWLPGSAEGFVWLRLYLADLGEVAAAEPLWWTLRRRGDSQFSSRAATTGGEQKFRRPLTYPALRAVLGRANQALGANYCWHDLRHTAALRMSRDESLTLRDVQTVLGHASVATTAGVYLLEDEARVLERVARHLAEHSDQAGHQAGPSNNPRYSTSTPGAGYDPADLSVLLGGELR